MRPRDRITAGSNTNIIAQNIKRAQLLDKLLCALESGDLVLHTPRGCLEAQELTTEQQISDYLYDVDLYDSEAMKL